MARLRVFVSSTCYDLDVLRSELRPFITSIGYEPVMSDYSDVLYDPRAHTHDSCVKEVLACDMVVLIIGSRFGGVAVPTAFAQLDLEALQQLSTKPALLEAKEQLSITQLEVLKAVEQSIPVYAFVDEKVMHDHHVYERNKDKSDVIDRIEFPSIQKKETARYIFEFINFLAHRVTNNSITPFARLDEIRSHLLSQWSQLFQRLVQEGRVQTREARRYRDFAERIEDLKAVVLASIATPDLRIIAKGAVQYRQLISFVSGLRLQDPRSTLLSDSSFDELLAAARIVEIREVDDRDRSFDSRLYLIRDDQTFFICRYPPRFIDDMRTEWGSFTALEDGAREAIADALLENRETRRVMWLRFIDTPIDKYLADRATTTSSATDGGEQS